MGVGIAGDLCFEGRIVCGASDPLGMLNRGAFAIVNLEGVIAGCMKCLFC